MNVFRRLSFYMGRKRVLMPISLLLSALHGLLSLLPLIFVWLIIRLLLTHPEEAIVDYFQWAWWAFATTVCSILLYFLALILSHLAAFRVECSMRKTAMQRLMQMPLGYFDTQTTGRIRKIIDEDSSQTHTFVAHLLPDFAGSIVSPLGVLILLFVVDWRLG